MINNLKTTPITHNSLCSVCIATYKRPILLRMLLESLTKQIIPRNINIEIIVVDNDSERTAESVVLPFSENKTFKISYYVQPAKNISITRNLAVEKACGNYILFIDDDEKASPEWIKYLVEAMNNFSADGVFGYVIPEFDEQTPDWLRRRDLFFYGNMQETGSEAKGTYTGNCIIKASLLKELRQPFDPSYGITGGEDVRLFQKLVSEGANFVNCREAIVTEYVPIERTTFRYFYQRALRGGNTNARRLIEVSGNKIFVRIFLLFKSISYSLIALHLFILTFPHKVLRLKWLVKLASNFGRFMAVFGWTCYGYK